MQTVLLGLALMDIIACKWIYVFRSVLVGHNSQDWRPGYNDPAGLTIQASSTTPAIIDANDIDRVLDVAAAAGNLTFSCLTVQNGNATGQATTTGGGISFGSTATLTLTNSTVSSNIAAVRQDVALVSIIIMLPRSTSRTARSQSNTCSVQADGGGLFKGNGGVLND